MAQEQAAGPVGAAHTASDFPTRSPRGAIRRAALIPGWGQLYNRQYLKLPVLYAGMGLFLASAVGSNADYVLYRRAFQYKAWQERVDSGQEDSNPKASFQSEYDQVVADLGPVSSSPMGLRRDNFRRNRDLAILGVGAFWALGILDAYVSAHLSDFDVGEDLTLSVRPAAPGTFSFADPYLAGIRISLGPRTAGIKTSK